jgi:hypothetical protein
MNKYSEESTKALNYFKALVLPVYQQLSNDKRVAVEDFILCYEGMMIDLDNALVKLQAAEAEVERQQKAVGKLVKAIDDLHAPDWKTDWKAWAYTEEVKL